jgi:hypothetical protein
MRPTQANEQTRRKETNTMTWASHWQNPTRNCRGCLQTGQSQAEDVGTEEEEQGEESVEGDQHGWVVV